MNAPAPLTFPPMTFFYSLRSPYAWLAWRLLHQYLPPAELERIALTPFWEPEPAMLARLEEARTPFLYRPMSRERHFYILGDVRRLARHLGYRVAFPGEARAGGWDLPHHACLAVPEPARRALIGRLFAARWEEGRDISDPAVVDGALAELGLPQRSAALGDEALRQQAFAALQKTHANQVFGVPFFVVGRERFWGVDRLPFALAAAGLPWRDLADAWLHGAAPVEQVQKVQEVAPC